MEGGERDSLQKLPHCRMMNYRESAVAEDMMAALSSPLSYLLGGWPSHES